MNMLANYLPDEDVSQTRVLSTIDICRRTWLTEVGPDLPDTIRRAARLPRERPRSIPARMRQLPTRSGRSAPQGHSPRQR